MKPGTPPLKSARLLDQVQERVRYLHYSLKTEFAPLLDTFFHSLDCCPRGRYATPARHGGD